MDIAELKRLTKEVYDAGGDDAAITWDTPVWLPIVRLAEFVERLEDEPAPPESAFAELKTFDAEPTLASFLEVAERHKYQVTFTPTHN